MSELKVYHHELRPNEYEEFYLKYEADKFISDLEESHKKEVGQLLIEVAELKAESESLLHQNRELCQALQVMYSKEEYDKQKYKRCMAMAAYWLAVSYNCVDERHRLRAEKHHKKWLELAKKFKEA